MVKGTKRKATLEKITKRESAATTYTKRTYGLHSKVAQLCLLTDAQIAVLATPPSANSNVSFFSFGHTSVDSIVNAYLKGGRPVREERDDHHDEDEDLGICLARKELGLSQWWESERLLETKNPEELRRAMNSVLRLLAKIKELRAEDADTRPGDDGAEPPLKKMRMKDETLKKTEQTLVPSEERVKTLEYNSALTDEELEKIMSTCDLDFDFDFESLNNYPDNSEAMKMAEHMDQPLIVPSDCCAPPDNNTFSSEEMMSSDYENDINQQLSDSDLNISSMFFYDSLLESTNSAMDSLASVDGGFVETSTIQEHLQETNSDSAVNDEDASFSDYLTQLLQF